MLPKTSITGVIRQKRRVIQSRTPNAVQNTDTILLIIFVSYHIDLVISRPPLYKNFSFVCCCGSVHFQQLLIFLSDHHLLFPRFLLWRFCNSLVIYGFQVCLLLFLERDSPTSFWMIPYMDISFHFEFTSIMNE